MNIIKFTYDKLESMKFGFSIFDILSQVFIKFGIEHFSYDSTFQSSLP